MNNEFEAKKILCSTPFPKDKRKRLSLEKVLNLISTSTIVEYIVSVILYGSSARGDDKWDSDVDLLVIFKSTLPEDLKNEILKIRGESLGLSYEDVPVDIHFYSSDTIKKFKEGSYKSVYLKNVQREGIVLW